MISYLKLLEVVKRHWQTTAVLDAPVFMQGETADVHRVENWFEVWMTQLNDPPQRMTGAALSRMLLDVHCFRKSSERAKVFEMADQVRHLLQHHCLSHAEHDEGQAEDATPSFHLRINEGHCRILTRESQPVSKFELQHVVVSFTATATAASGPNDASFD